MLPSGWSTKSLREIGQCIGGLTYSPGDVVDKAEGMLVLRSSNIKHGELAFEDNVFVRKTIPVDAQTREGDILVCVRNGSRRLIGKSALIKGAGIGVVHGAFMLLFRSNESAFVYQLFQSPQYYRQVHENLGATINSINSSDFYEFQFPFPPKEERSKIADALALWDAAIKNAERLIALRAKQRAWILSQVALFSNRKGKLGDFLVQVNRPVPRPATSYWALGIRSHGKGTFQRFVEDPTTVDMEELYEVKRDDLIINITFAWEGAIASVNLEDERCLVSHRFPTYEVNRNLADPRFVKYIVNRKSFFSQLALISPGGAGRNRVLNKKDFLKLAVPLPPLGEQKRLATILETLDQFIEKQTAQLTAIKNQKRGLMQKLLTGKWRPKLPESAVA